MIRPHHGEIPPHTCRHQLKIAQSSDIFANMSGADVIDAVQMFVTLYERKIARQIVLVSFKGVGREAPFHSQ